MQGAHHVEAPGVGEQPELGAGPGVEVQQVVRAGLRVAAEVQVGDAPVAQRGEQVAGQALDGRVRRPGAHGGQSRAVGPGADLPPGRGHPARPGAVAVRVEEPVAVPAGRQVPLEQQRAAGLRHARVEVPYLARGAGQDGAAQPRARRQQPGTAPLGDHGQPQGGGHGGGLVGVGGHQGARVRDAQAAAGRGEPGLVGDARGEPRRLVGQEEAAGGAVRFPAQLVQGEGGGVVQGQQDGGRAAEGSADPGERVADAGEAVAGRTGVALPHVPRPRHRLAGSPRHDVDGHAGAAEGPGGAERAVVERVPVQAQQHGGDPGVEERHGMSSSRCPDWAVKCTDGLGAGRSGFAAGIHAIRSDRTTL
ncbi:hypothetical protein BG846_05698 [Streptomyces fradiae ATCC 10745 = DSM 40063]|uniref:Uncharacterized protein n=1 Tax=Streptomyces fradiae ATCC 10745 = DSM 40063 TaxID=1319510 RepID=A0A1Y2NMB7_STRFR|nr:hypothetical protein BG846_05698 [Streptomyces fradiae ATCC 10745 = DSM 40063]